MAYLIVDVPKPGDIRTNQVSTILASDGSELAKIVPPEGNRVDVNIDQIPVHVRNAVMAAEDRDFYSNPGFSFTGFARAFKNNIFGGDLQGGSTITQQYVKNALVGDARSGLGGLVRKAKELVISTKMSGEWSKDQVLQSYLNIIYFGRGAYGISAASKAYFDKPVEQLTVAEGALLAALIQRPSGLDPAVNPEGAAERWNWVLDGMVDIGALSPQDRAAQQFPPTVPPEQARSQDQTTGPNGLIERQVTQELLDLFNIDEQTLNTQGLQITTTIDPKAQQAAEAAASKYLDGQDPDMRTAIVSIDPKTGAVKAYYGGQRRQRVRLRAGRVADGFVVQGVRVGGRAAAGHGPGLPGGQLTGRGQRHQDHQRRGRRVRHLQHRRGVEAVAEHQLLPIDAQAEERARTTSPTPRTRPASPRASPVWITRCPRTARADHRTTELCWASIRLACSTWRRRTPRLPASGVYHKPHFVQKVVNSRGRGAVRRQPGGQHRRAAHRQGSGRQRHLRDAADRRVLQRAQPGRRASVGGQDRNQSAR